MKNIKETFQFKVETKIQNGMVKKVMKNKKYFYPVFHNGYSDQDVNKKLWRTIRDDFRTVSVPVNNELIREFNG